MKLYLLSITALIACFLPVVHADEPPQSNDTKKPMLAEKSAGNTDTSIGANKGFGAQLFIIEDQTFFKNWNKPSEAIHIPEVNQAKRGTPVFAIILFAGPGANEKNLCDVSYSFQTITPEGKKYGKPINGDCWKDLPPPASGQTQLSRGYMGIRIEDTDPSGRYIVKAIVYDHIKDIKLELTQYFDVD